MWLSLLYRLPLALFCGAIFWQSSYPSVISEPLFPCDDKVMHLVAYAMMGILAARWIRQEKQEISPLRLRILALAFTILYGMSDEIHQAFVPDRSASVMDWLADGTGALIGVWFYDWFLKNGKPVIQSLLKKV